MLYVDTFFAWKDVGFRIRKVSLNDGDWPPIADDYLHG